MLAASAASALPSVKRGLHVLHVACAPTGDDRDRRGFGDHPGKSNLVTVLCAVRVDTVNAQLARAELLAASRPLDGVDPAMIRPPWVTTS